MSRSISESDWKVFRRLREVALKRFCQRVLDEIGALAANDGRTSHERYLAAFKLMQRRNDELADAFDNPRRSMAWQQLTLIQAHELLTDEEMRRFNPETREVVQFFLTRGQS